MVMRLMRQSLLGSADTCLRRAQYDIDPDRPRSTSEARAIGVGYHAGLEAYYRARQAGGPCAPDQEQLRSITEHAIRAFRAEIPDEFTWETSQNDCELKVSSMLATYFGEQHYWPDAYAVIAVEETFTAPWTDGWDRHGTIDLALGGPDGWTYLVDHKTAGRRWPANKEHPRKNNQAPWYVRAWRDMTGDTQVRFVFDVMTYGGQFERRVSDPEPRHELAVLERARAVAVLLDAGIDLPGNPSSTLCSPRWCDHWSVCPYGGALE